MKAEMNQTMLAVPYIRGWHLKESRSRQMIKRYAAEAYVLTNQINKANGGMFTRNIEARALYFKSVMEKSIDQYEQVLVLGIGLDTKLDEIPLLSNKEIYAIDLEAASIKRMYNETHLATKVNIVEGNLLELEDNSVLHGLIAMGFDPNKSTFVIWEGGTFYLSELEVMKTLLYLKKNITMTRFAGDFLNAEVFQHKKNEAREMIDEVLTILKNSGNEWKGFFYENSLKEFFLRNFSFNHFEMKTHGEVESLLYTETVVIPDLVFFVDCF